MKSRVLWNSLAFLSAGAAACSAPYAETTDEQGVEQTEPLYGSRTYNADCDEDPTGNGTLAEYQEMAMEMGRIAGSSNAFVECMNTAVRQRIDWSAFDFGPYRACNGDPFKTAGTNEQIASALNASWTTHDVEIECVSSGSSNASASIGTYDSDAEKFRYHAWLRNTEDDRHTGGDSSWLAWPWPARQAAAITWHEVSHTHGYTHGANSQDSAIVACGYAGDPTWHYQKNTMPYIIGDCLNYVLKRSQVNCGLVPGSNACPDGEMLLTDGHDSTTCHCVPDTTRLGQIEASDQTGYALAVGDFDGNGFDDLAVGSPGEDGNTGRVFVYRGTPTGLMPFRAYTQDGTGVNEAGDQFGFSLAGGDFNGDGFDDLAVGAPGEDVGDAINAGAVFVLLGSADGLEMWGWKSQAGMGSNESGDQFGYAVVAADFNADTELDLAVGAPNEGLGNVHAGHVFIFKGDATSVLTAWQGVSQPSSAAGDLFGFSLANVHLTGSETSMLAVGAPGKNGLRGIAYLVTISVSTFVASHTFDVADQSGELAGYSLAAGDFDGDGDDDLAIGAPGDTVNSNSSAGTVYLRRSNGANLLQWQTLRQSSPWAPEAQDYFGYALAAAGRKLVVGSPGEAPFDAQRAGSAYLYSYSSSSDQMIGSALLRKNSVDEEQATDYFGHRVASGDFDGNGQPDIAVGSPFDDQDGQLDAGGMYTFRGTSAAAWARLDQVAIRRSNIAVFP
jgi:hypothetical protein